MEKELLTTSMTPRKYYKECLEKGIRRCSKCGDIKSLDEFGESKAPNNKVYRSSHCNICVSKRRQAYVKKKGYTQSFKKKKRDDSTQGRNNLRAAYVADNLTSSFCNFGKRHGYNISYPDVHKCITPEMLIAKEMSIRIQRLMKKK